MRNYHITIKQSMPKFYIKTGIYDLTKLTVFMQLIILRILMELVYVYGLATNYKYSGYYIHPNTMRYVLSWILFLILLPSVINRIREISFSNTVYVLLFSMSYVPGCVMMGYRDTPFIAYYFLYWLCFALFMKFFEKRKVLLFKQNAKIVITSKQMVGIGIFFTIIALFIWGKYAHFRVNFNLLNVYQYREEAGSYDLPILLSYLYSWVTRIMPFMLVWSLSKQYIGLTILFSFTQLIYFFVDGSKSALFMLFLVIGAYLALKNNTQRIRFMIVAFIFVLIACLLQLIILHGGIGKILSVFVRRVFFVPAQLNYDYYSFFTRNPLNLYSNIIKFRPSRYPMGIALEIGKFRLGTYGESDNNGLFSDAFANLGIAGMVVLPFLIAMTLRLLDDVSENLDKAVLIAPIIVVSRPLFGSSFFTGLITHGIMVYIILLYVMPRRRWEKFFKR